LATETGNVADVAMGWRETLQHLVCHCRPNSFSITKCHSGILGRLVKVFHAHAFITIRLNQVVPSVDESLQLEPITIDEACKNVTFIEVTMTNENRCTSFQAAGHKTQKKYTPLLEL